MADDNTYLLAQAQQRGQDGDLRGARQLIRQALEQDRTDYRAWWALAEAATSNKERRMAVEQVLKLRPDHPHAQHMLDQIRAGSIESAAVAMDEFESAIAGASFNPTRAKNDFAYKQELVAQRDFLLPAVVTLLGYFFLPFAGIILNLFFLYEANKLFKTTGIRQTNVGCLQALIVVFIGLPVCACGALLVFAR
jgi:hypothetical protein